MKIEVQIGEEVTVVWANGAGETVYRVVENPRTGPALFEVVREVEYGASPAG